MTGLQFIFNTFNFNPSQLARELDWSRFTVRDWIAGRRKISRDRLNELEHYFGVPKKLLIKEVDNIDKRLICDLILKNKFDVK